jgi:hypothetical protein
MQASCQTFSPHVVQDILEVVARALCDRPGESGAQRASRTHQLVLTTLGMGARDGLELFLSATAFGHFGMILDSIKDVQAGMTPALKLRAKAGIVAMDRALVSLLREFREARSRPAEQACVGVVRPEPAQETAFQEETVQEEVQDDPAQPAAQPAADPSAAAPEPTSPDAPPAGAAIDPGDPGAILRMMDDPAFMAEVEKVRDALVREFGPLMTPGREEEETPSAPLRRPGKEPASMNR